MFNVVESGSSLHVPGGGKGGGVQVAEGEGDGDFVLPHMSVQCALCTVHAAAAAAAYARMQCWRGMRARLFVTLI